MYSIRKFLPISSLRHCVGVPCTSAMRGLIWLLSAMCLLTLPAWAGHSSQPEETHFTELSLEELLEVPVDPNAVNILESHIHRKGEWMIGARHMTMEMDGNRDGTSRQSTASVLSDFPVAPTDMRMDMHMVSLMYAPSDDLTLMAMFPYTRIAMDHVTRTGVRFTTRSDGVGDIRLVGNNVILRKPENRHLLSVLGGLSLPTGSIDERDATPAGPNQKLPYPMQLGSGTYDLIAGLSYLGLSEDWSWGVRGLGIVRLGENDNDYTLGDRLETSAWGTRRWTDWLSASVRLDGQSWGNIDGADPDLNPSIVPTADPDRRGGTRVDLLFGIEVLAPSDKLKGHRFGIEVGAPIYQSLDGPQLETDWRVTVGWQWTF